MTNKFLKISVLVASIFLVGFMGLVFQGKFILSQAFSLGYFSVHYYGVVMALAVVSSFYLAIKNSPDFFSNKQQAENFLFWLIVGGFIGARIYHVLTSYEYYSAFPKEIFYIWHGGLSIYGAVLGGFATVLIYKKISKFKYPVLNILNWLTVPLLLGQIIGRFGNFFNYELYGYPTKLSWACLFQNNLEKLII